MSVLFCPAAECDRDKESQLNPVGSSVLLFGAMIYDLKSLPLDIVCRLICDRVVLNRSFPNHLGDYFINIETIKLLGAL